MSNPQNKCVQSYVKNGVTQYTERLTTATDKEIDYSASKASNIMRVVAILKDHRIITCNLKGKKWWACVVDVKAKTFLTKLACMALHWKKLCFVA